MCGSCVPHPATLSPSPPLQEKAREEKQVEISNRIREALHCGMKVLDDAFEILEYEHTAGEGDRGGIDCSNISIQTPVLCTTSNSPNTCIQAKLICMM